MCVPYRYPSKVPNPSVRTRSRLSLSKTRPPTNDRKPQTDQVYDSIQNYFDVRAAGIITHMSRSESNLIHFVRVGSLFCLFACHHTTEQRRAVVRSPPDAPALPSTHRPTLTIALAGPSIFVLSLLQSWTCSIPHLNKGSPAG